VGKAAEHKADHLPLCSTEVKNAKNAWGFTSTSVHFPDVVLRYRDNFYIS